jgi:Ca-activated chloride channel family protein
MNQHLSLSSSVILTPRRAGLRDGGENVVDVLVRVQAPDAPAGLVPDRPPQALALVLDRSGSMSGQPLHEARRCAEYVVGRLRPTDSMSLVQFDNRVQRLWPAVPVSDGVALRVAIAGIEAGGNTNLHGGWMEGADSLSDIAGQGLKRVILLSDGQANEGLTDHDAIAAQCAQLAARGITTSTYGLGRSFNEDLMVAMARAGGGNHYYGETAEDLMDPFQQELELLGNLCMRELHLSAKVADGITCELLNALPSQDGGWRLPDLAWGAEAWAVLRLKVPVTSMPASGSRLSLLQVTVTARSLEGKTVQLERAALALPVLTAAEHDGLADDELVSRRLSEIAAAQALRGLRAAATRGDWGQVDRLLAEAHRQFAGNAWVSAVLASMTSVAASRSRERLSKEAMYSSETLINRLASKMERLSAGEQLDDADLPAYLRRKPAQGKGKV